MNGITAFHRYVEENAASLVETLFEGDATLSTATVNHVVIKNYFSSSESPLQVAIEKGNSALVLRLLDKGAIPHIDFETWYVLGHLCVGIELTTNGGWVL